MEILFFRSRNFDEKWKIILEYEDLMTNTDLLTLSAFNSIIEILKPYAKQKGKRKNTTACKISADNY